MSNIIESHLLAKGDPVYIRKTVGEEDFCDNGCIIIDQIRVPFPDCARHGGPLNKGSVDYLNKDSIVL